ncbi:hypothetical protein Pmani_037739 [Petrolisthes manimaculis]|uniref:Uncharacterized protein n=1 Tax=Petrolisthes manimaculis TaxID=1843537 RepID=A0AAE1TN02_9EUCA|nr:hypothetical protein Pmani_037739 [Petrolisthes manimaculis]
MQGPVTGCYLSQRAVKTRLWTISEQHVAQVLCRRFAVNPFPDTPTANITTNTSTTISILQLYAATTNMSTLYYNHITLPCYHHHHLIPPTLC